MKTARAITNLVEAFERLPGIGPKTAQRLTYYLLHVPQFELERFAEAVKTLKTSTKECSVCHNIDEADPCDVCTDMGRDKSVVCVVEQPLNVTALERGGWYGGVYHVLHGVIDPLHNVGPDEIRIDELMARIKSEKPAVAEIILALNPNMEGEATCLYLKRQLTATGVKVTRLAHGLPVGADIEYADEVTLKRALDGRREY